MVGVGRHYLGQRDRSAKRVENNFTVLAPTLALTTIVTVVDLAVE